MLMIPVNAFKTKISDRLKKNLAKFKTKYILRKCYILK